MFSCQKHNSSEQVSHLNGLHGREGAPPPHTCSASARKMAEAGVSPSATDANGLSGGSMYDRPYVAHRRTRCAPHKTRYHTVEALAERLAAYSLVSGQTPRWSELNDIFAFLVLLCAAGSLAFLWLRRQRFCRRSAFCAGRRCSALSFWRERWRSCRRFAPATGVGDLCSLRFALRCRRFLRPRPFLLPPCAAGEPHVNGTQGAPVKVP
jgi:hypothetical protein